MAAIAQQLKWEKGKGKRRKSQEVIHSIITYTKNTGIIVNPTVLYTGMYCSGGGSDGSDDKRELEERHPKSACRIPRRHGRMIGICGTYHTSWYVQFVTSHVLIVEWIYSQTTTTVGQDEQKMWM